MSRKIAFRGLRELYTCENRDKSSCAHRRQLFLEELETRRVLAGVCDIELDVYGTLTIDCDDAGNDIIITGGAQGDVTIAPNGGETLNGPTAPSGVTDIKIDMDDGDDTVFVDDIDITGDLHIDGGDDSNTNIVEDSMIGDDVEIKNDDTDHGTDHDGSNGGFDGFTGQYNLVQRNVIGGDVEVDNGESESTADGRLSAGNYNRIADNTIGRVVTVENAHGESSTTGNDANSYGNLTRIDSNDEIVGDVSVDNAYGISSTSGTSLDSHGNYTSIDSNENIGADVTVVNEEGISLTTGDSSGGAL